MRTTPVALCPKLFTFLVYYIPIRRRRPIQRSYGFKVVFYLSPKFPTMIITTYATRVMPTNIVVKLYGKHTILNIDNSSFFSYNTVVSIILTVANYPISKVESHVSRPKKSVS
jgi:hypothetical protein